MMDDENHESGSIEHAAEGFVQEMLGCACVAGSRSDAGGREDNDGHKFSSGPEPGNPECATWTPMRAPVKGTP